MEKLKSRSANHGIKGYIYQFTKSIELILELNKTETLTLEGYEDIDIHKFNSSTLVQCKYHESNSFAPSRVYKPVCEMIKHFLTSTKPIKYWLFAHFGNNPPKNSDWVTIEFLKASISKSKKPITITNEQLNDFLLKFNYINGDKLDIFERKVKEALRKELSCSSIDVENYFYNNAISLIANLSSKNNEADRKINKKSFIKQINRKQYLFDLWMKELKGKSKYIKYIKDQLKNNALSNTKNRLLLISSEMILNESSINKLKNLLVNLNNEFPIIGQLYNSKLWTVIIQADDSIISDIKSHLIKHKVYYNDGYEDILFDSEYFNKMPIINSTRSDRISKSSHTIKLISESTFKKNFSAIVKDNNLQNTYICISSNINDHQYFTDDENVLTCAISAIDNLSDLNLILRNK